MLLSAILFLSEANDAISPFHLSSPEKSPQWKFLNLSSNNAFSESGGKLKRIQIKILLCAAGCICQQSPPSYTQCFSLSHEIFFFYLSLHEKAAPITCVCMGGVSSSQIKWLCAHVRFSPCLCNFRCNDPANSSCFMPEGNREK